MIMHNLYSIDKEVEDQRWDLAKLEKLWTIDNLHKGCHHLGTSIVNFVCTNISWMRAVMVGMRNSLNHRSCK